MKGGRRWRKKQKKPARLWKRRAGTTTNWGCTYTAKKITNTGSGTDLWEFQPGDAARKMAVYDPDYNRSLSGVIAENAEIILKAAQDMAGWGLAECEPARKEETPQG